MSRNLTSTLIERLRRDIVDGRITAGEKLPSEAALIATHGVSRTVVREAITRLQAEGLVHTRKGSGSFALTPPADAPGLVPARLPRTLEERHALLAFRMGVECEAAALAASARTRGHLAVLEASLASFAAAQASPAEALAHDYDFHHAIAQASCNPYFTDLVTSLGPTMIAMPRHRLESGRSAGGKLGDVTTEHVAVLAAVEAQDAQAASAAMRTHLVNSRRRLDAVSGARRISEDPGT